MKAIAIFGILAVAAIGAFIYFKKRKEKTAAGEVQELPSTKETSNTSTQAEQKIKVQYRDKDGGRYTQNATQALLDKWVLLSVNNNGKGDYIIVNAKRGLVSEKWLLSPTKQSTLRIKTGYYDGQQFKPTLAVTQSQIEPAAPNFADWAIVYNKNTKQIYLVEPESARAVGLIK